MTRSAEGTGSSLIPFIDLMLCAIGCALIVFVALLLRPHGHGGGWHDRPLIVQAWVEAGPTYGDLLCTWELSRDGASDGGEPGVARVESALADKKTTNRSRMLFLVPEADFGTWNVVVHPTARLVPVDDLTRHIPSGQTADDYLIPGDREISERHGDWFRRTRRAAEGSEAEASSMLAELRSSQRNDPGLIRNGLGAGKSRDDVTDYLESRRHALIARLVTRGDMRRVEEVRAMRPDTDLSIGKDILPSRRHLQPGLAYDAAVHPASDPTPEAIEGANNSLDALLASSYLDPNAAELHSDSYYHWRNELIRWRALLESGRTYRPNEVKIKDYWPQLYAALARTRRDLVGQIVADELSLLAGGDRGMIVRMHVMWGDTAAARIGSVASPIVIRLRLSDLDRDVVLASIILEKDSQGPLVVPAPDRVEAP